MKMIIATFFCFLFFQIHSQDYKLVGGGFVIDGRVMGSSNTKGKKVILTTDSMFEATVGENGVFQLKGILVRPAAAQITVENSYSEYIWLENGNYRIDIIDTASNNPERSMVRIQSLSGPRDAQIEFGFQKLYFLKGVQLQRAFVRSYLDSIFKTYPNARVLPLLINRSKSLMENNEVLLYMSQLDSIQKEERYFKVLENSIFRENELAAGRQMGDVKIADTAGNLFKLSDLKSKKLIYLDVWASWCIPCRRKHPSLVQLYKKYADSGFEIIGISLDSDGEEWKKAIRQSAISWKNLSELKGFNSAFAKKYRITSLPFGILLNQNLEVLGTELSEDLLRQYLKLK